ncbi:hypothetical protein GCK32_013512 [Trichostrongylus colubriformis]|uniref:Uncharacterized protein n=1 Tax=Trichostrongylus colubriformis TaxID=6319 RepID=A0AAN8FDA4_TRICO
MYLNLLGTSYHSMFTFGAANFDQVIADIKTAKNAGKAKAEVFDIGYTSMAGQVTKPLMENLCTKLVPLITKLEWKCFLTHSKSLIDFTMYECSKIVKP